MTYQAPNKFKDPLKTAKNEERAYVDLQALDTLWINTGTLCNIECKGCYIRSSPRYDVLVYITHAEVCEYLDEIKSEQLGTKEIGITGGEPFMNSGIIQIMEECLSRGFKLIMLTNAMRPMMRFTTRLLNLKDQYPDQITVRVSIDHFNPHKHEEQRGEGTWGPMIKGLKWLSDNDFTIDVAGRTCWSEGEQDLRKGFNALFAEHNINVDANSRKQLVLFPEMNEKIEVPEITTKCWDILELSPNAMMCSNSRMIVKRKGADKPAVVACTLLPYEEEFELASTLKESAKRVHLNHPHCAKFCVLGGGVCSVSED